MNQAARAELLKSLHVKGNPLILFNVWDAGSARVLQESGAKAIATGSWSVAAAHGFDDGEQLPLDLAIENLRRIVASVDLPVSLDFEGAYGRTTSEVQSSIWKVIDAGGVGINFEDQILGGENLYSIEDQCARIRAIRETSDQASVPLFLNARTDLFLKSEPADHAQHMAEALRRATAYAESGASGFFVPGLKNTELIARICEHSPLPVNFMMLKDAPSRKELAQLGVGRISYGPIPYRLAMSTLREAAQKALSNQP